MKKPKFEFYERANGKNEFLNFVKKLPKKDREKLSAVIIRTQTYGIQTAISQEWVKRLDDNLYELRSKAGSNIQRALYFHVVDNHYVITHGFTKKTQKTPSTEIAHAKELREEFYRRKKHA